MAKKYYWLKLKQDFFKQHEIRIIEEMENGKDYILFYLKLLVESISHSGHLRFSETVPYNDKMLGTITNTNVDVVRSAIKIFTELNLMEMLDDGTIYMKETEKMIGNETEWAEKKRLYREALKDNVLTMSDKRLDIDKDIDIDNITTTNISNIFNYIEENYGRMLTPIEYEKINSWLLLFSEDIIKYAIEIAVNNGKKTISYLDGILKNWKGHNYQSLEEIKENESKKGKPQKEVPEWFDKNIEKEATIEEKVEMDKLLKEFGG